jgi:hypothetical protein
MSGWSGVDPAQWAETQQDVMLRVFQRALVLLAAEMIRTKDEGGALPKVTGNLARSLLAQIGNMPSVQQGDFAGTDVGAIAAQAVLGDEVFLGFQAAYARRRNYGFVGEDALGRNYNETGDHFVERAIDMWPQIVDQALQDVKGGVGV